jgi:hypothetical protein
MFRDHNEGNVYSELWKSTISLILIFFLYRFTVIMSSTLENALRLADGYLEKTGI